MNTPKHALPTITGELGTIVAAQLIKNAVIVISTLLIGEILEAPNHTRRVSGTSNASWRPTDRDDVSGAGMWSRSNCA